MVKLWYSLVGGFNQPIWKMMDWKSVGMDGNSQLNGTKTSNMFQTTNQKLWFKQWTLDLMTQIWDLTIFQGCIQQEKGDLSILKQTNIGI